VSSFLKSSARKVLTVVPRSVIGDDILHQNQYDNHTELQKLKPWNPVFWVGSGLSILNYSTDFFDMIRDGKIRVHIENIDRLGPGKVVLGNSRVLNADAIICSTGWRKESTITFAGLGENGLALPLGAKEQAHLGARYDAEVVEKFPVLEAPPTLRSEFKEVVEPLRYYRFMVPAALLVKRNFAFAGMISSVSTAICASMQGMWITAFFDGKLEREAGSQEDVTREIMMHTQWGKWRYPCGYGAHRPDLVFESIPYADMLLKDIGIENKRKPSLLQELLLPYTPQDYRGVHEEFAQKHITKE